MSGMAVVYLRPDGAEGMGHVGWGYNLPNGQWMVGAVENLHGWWGPYTPPGQTDFWHRLVSDPVSVMANPPSGGAPQGTPAYAKARLVDVACPNPGAAQAKITEWLYRPYTLVGGNCMNCTYDVLTTFGAALPAPSEHWFPNSWFAAINGRDVAP